MKKNYGYAVIANELLQRVNSCRAAINTFMDDFYYQLYWMGESDKGVGVLKLEFKPGKVYSGYKDEKYYAFEVKTVPEGHSVRIDVTYSENPDVMREGEQRVYEYHSFFRLGEWREVATDFTHARIDLALLLKQKEWFYDELKGTSA